MAPRRLTLLTGLLLLTAGLLLRAEPATAEQLSEYQLKAELLYRLTRFVYWPEAALAADDEHVNICVLGQDPFGAALDGIVGKTCQGRTVKVERHINVGPMAENCQVVFISPSEAARIPAILDRLKDKPILTMGDDPVFVAEGGHIGLTTQAGVVSIAVNLESSKEAGLQIGAEILQLAEPAGGSKR